MIITCNCSCMRNAVLCVVDSFLYVIHISFISHIRYILSIEWIIMRKCRCRHRLHSADVVSTKRTAMSIGLACIHRYLVRPAWLWHAGRAMRCADFTFFLFNVPLGYQLSQNVLDRPWPNFQDRLVGIWHMGGHDQSDLIFAIAQGMLLW